MRSKRARLVRGLSVALVVVLVVGLLGVVGVGWYFSGVALAVDTDPVPPVQVTVAGDTITLPRQGSTAEAGLHAVRFEDGGWGIMAGEVGGGAGTVVRTWEAVEGTAPDGATAGTVDSDVYLDSPASRDLDYEDVTVTSDIGDLPTWFVPADGDTWVVFAHGRGGSREEALRYLPLWHDLGLPVLVPAYRNDAIAPPAENGSYGFGETEWRDIDAAVAYALDNGARQVILAGWSMGGAIAMQVLDRSEHRDAVVAVVLDAPVLDWNDTFTYQGSTYGLPDWMSWVAIRFIEVRGGLRMSDFDWVARADELPDDVPIYIVHSDGDTYVPNGPSKALAQARPDIVTLDTDSDAGHTREWNVDPEAYEGDMSQWLAEMARTSVR